MAFEPPSSPATLPPSTTVEYVERRSRLTTFFRYFLVIPHLIVLTFYGIAAYVAIVIAWFALVITGQWPRGLYDFVAGFERYVAAVTGYYLLLTDAYPPFGGETSNYPVRITVGPPKAHYSRLKVLLRIILVIPVYIIAYALQIVAMVGAFISWFVIVVTGKQPRGLQEMIELGFSYLVRAQCYYSLLSEDWPPFTNPGGSTTASSAPGPGIAGLDG